MSDEPTWIDYYDEQGDREPRELLLDVLEAFGEGVRDAVDLGCGQGIDTVAMLERGWRVFAVDSEPEGVRRLLERVPLRLAGALRAEVAPMEDLELPAVDLVWASFSLLLPTRPFRRVVGEGPGGAASRGTVRGPVPR